MITNYDESCIERCQRREGLETQVLQHEEHLAELSGFEVFEGEISCSGLCLAVPGERRCYAAVVQPFAMETSEVPVRL